jgi:putative membrane protein
MLRLLIVWLINAAALLLLPVLVPSIRIEGFGTALIVVLVLGLINALLRPLLILLTLPVTLLTLGLFIFVINALLFQLAAEVIPGFTVGGFWPALFGSLIYSLVSWAISGLLPGKD